MLLMREFGVRVGETLSPPAVSKRRPAAKLGSLGFDSHSAGGSVGKHNGSRDSDCRRVCPAAGDLLARLNGGEGRNFLAGQIGGFSHDSEHDLAVMVSDFLENGSSGNESMYSSDSDSGFADLSHLAAKVSFHKHAMTRSESDLLCIIHSLILSIKEIDLYLPNELHRSDSCIRQTLVKLLKRSGYDAALCISKWQGSDKVPGGDHEYIDVILNGAGHFERLIIDIDFHSHFEIARAVESYDAIMGSLPVVYVGSLPRLKQFLQVMVDAAKFSLKQNSMPLPPWRSMSYLQAKWFSKYERIESFMDHDLRGSCYDHKQCIEHLQRLKTFIKLEMESERSLNPIKNDKKKRVSTESRRSSLLSF